MVLNQTQAVVEAVIMDLTQFFTTLGSHTVTLGFVAFLAKKLIENGLEKTTAIQLEQVRSSARLREIEHNVRFASFHVQQAELARDLYANLFEIVSSLNDAMTIQLGHGSQQRLDELNKPLNAIQSFRERFEPNRILLPRDLAAQIHEFIKEIQATTREVHSHSELLKEQTEHSHPGIKPSEQENEFRRKVHGIYNKAREAVKKYETELLTSLEDRFRSIVDPTYKV